MSVQRKVHDAPITIETCVASVDDALAACAGGADRLELNVGVELGGLTPSVALLEHVQDAVNIPVVVMVRPRAAGFCYTPREQHVILRDSELLLSAGADGIVSGALLADGTLNEPFWQSLRRVTAGSELVFHRAFDVAKEHATLLERLIDTGTTRVLTSGGAKTAWEGRDQLAGLVRMADHRIEVLPASGITPDNVVALVKATGCRQVHGTFRNDRYDDANCVAESSFPATSKRLVAATRAALDQPISG